MLIKDKIILVLYIGCQGKIGREVQQRTTEARYTIAKELQDESCLCVVLPDFDALGCRLECINPNYLTEEQQNKLSEALDTFLAKSSHVQVRSEEK